MKGEEGRVGEERRSENETPNILKMPSKLSMATSPQGLFSKPVSWHLAHS